MLRLPLSFPGLLSVVLIAACAGDAPETMEEPDTLGVDTVAIAPAPGSCPGAGEGSSGEGWAHYRAGDMAAARSAFDASLERCPGHLAARTGLGFVTLHEGAPAAAEQIFASVIESDEGHVDAHLGLGIVAWRRGDPATARGHLERALQLDGGNEEARTLLARIREDEAAGITKPIG